MTVNIDLSLDELKIVKKALSGLSYNIYLGKASKQYADMEKQVNTVYDKIADLYNGFMEANNE